MQHQKLAPFWICLLVRAVGSSVRQQHRECKRGAKQQHAGLWMATPPLLPFPQLDPLPFEALSLPPVDAERAQDIEETRHHQTVRP